MTDAGDSEEFIADVERHNEWWSGDTSRDLTEATTYPPRSDLHNLLKTLNRKRENGTESLVYPIFGQTGIGKTTMLFQFIASIREDTSFLTDSQDMPILDSVSPRQILYVPLEDSLYHLERPADALARLRDVLEYFRSHVAPRKEPKYVFLDDIGALNLNELEDPVLLDLVESDTYLILTGIVESQVDFTDHPVPDQVDEVCYPQPVLPMKFIDTLKHAPTDGGVHPDIDSDFRDRIESYQSPRTEGPSPIKTVRKGLGTGDTDVDTAVEALDALYFDHFSDNERDDLHDAARDYLRTGGTLHSVDDPSVRNDLVRSNFLIYLYKELASHESIQQPKNLHRLSSIAASRAGEELQYTDVSEQLDVDRRTVDAYLDALDEGLAVTESHDYSLRRYRRTRLYLRNPRHVVLLSRRGEHYGFERYGEKDVLNHEFEYKLARTVAFDHAMRLAYTIDAYDVEYCETEAGTVDYVLHREGFVVPFVLSYHPYASNAKDIATAFDPESGQHTKRDGEELIEHEYEAPYRFIITDSLPRETRENQSLVVERNGTQLCYIPYWLFLLIS